MRLPPPLLAGAALLALSAAPLVAVKAEPITFDLTGTLQTFTVPTTGTYDIVAVGAGGGGSSSFDDVVGYGGLGARIEDRFSLTAGEVLGIVVGGQGSLGYTGNSGGGGSFVVASGDTPLLIAGGGGGGGGAVDTRLRGIAGSEAYDGPPPLIRGGDALGLAGTGDGGASGATGTNRGGGGGGGVLGDGGSGENGPGFNAATGGRAFVNGAAGGNPEIVTSSPFPVLPRPVAPGGFGGGGGGGGTGGGGGGYSGGRGGAGLSGEFTADSSLDLGAGLGGTSFDAGANPRVTLGANAGNGSVVITLLDASPDGASPTAVPEPAGFGLLTAGLFGLGLARRRK